MDTHSCEADGLTGRQFWRSLEERLADPLVLKRVAQDFPEYAEKLANSVTRRHFLTLLGASLGLAGLAGCSSTQAPREKIVPYTRQPEQLVLGKPLYFATAMPLAGSAIGLLVESHEGRPTKVEGNPSHPTNLKLGATDAFAQASVLSLYDPDRSRMVTYRGRTRSWAEARLALREAFTKQLAKNQGKGAGLRVLTGAVASPTLADQMNDLLSRLPEARHIAYEPARLGAAAEGARLAFGEVFDVRYDLRGADVILALDADFLTCGPGHLLNARDFAARRRVGTDAGAMNRLYAVEPTPSGTGLVADHRLTLAAAQVEQVARLLARTLEVGEDVGGAEMPEKAARWVRALADDLRTKPGASAVIVGEGQPPAVHALAFAINAKLGNLGKTVLLTRPEKTKSQYGIDALAELAREMDQGKVETLLILGANLVYTAPADLEFVHCLQKVPLRFHLGLYNDETAMRCDWHIPEAHYLEAWGDVRSEDGTAAIVQPLIAPLYGGVSANEFLSNLLEEAPRSGHAIVEDYWRRMWAKREPASRGSFDHFWRQALHDGFVADSARKTADATLKAGWASRINQEKPAGGEYEILFRPDPTIFDGRFANNGWLQELPKPVTLLCWDNAILVSPATAEKLGVRTKEGRHGGSHGEGITDVVELEYQGRMIRAPVWIVPGQADGTLTVHFGYGRTHAGKLGSNIGFNAYALWTTAAPYFGSGAKVRKTGERFTLACTQVHHSMELTRQAEQRHIIRAGTLDQFKADPHFASDEAVEQKARGSEKPNGERLPLSLYPPDDWKYEGYKWGMAIDLGACTGCSACVVACQAENNIPVVGKVEVTRGHEMHWIRIDRYFAGSDNDPTRAYFQPVPCMHCENAPCELVCPVEATTHSIDGLNEMTYNRCVGTRYCSNNCPYKVRRFNFLQYADYTTPMLKMLNNPDVTVRSRGVMEKCTYCVQRIRGAEIEARNQGRKIRDGDVVTACQAACPAGAITFGDLNDKKSRVAQTHQSPLNYGLLTELNTNPRTTYLAAIRNPNPALEPQ
jgi:MoCo/4Fe-4S cofactor protein with predicted Tat translocation signal